MTIRTAPVVPDWLKPGARVILYSGYAGTGRVSRAEVAKVAVHTFTVTGSPLRFRIRGLGHQSGDGVRTRVVPEDSPEARTILAAAKRRLLICKARTACETWIRSPGPKTRLAAIAALQAVEDEPHPKDCSYDHVTPTKR